MGAGLSLSVPVGEYESLLEFLYVCPHGLAEFGAEGTVSMINPACSRILMPLLPPAAGGRLTNILDLLAPFAPDLGHRLAGFGQASGLVLDGMQIHVGRWPETAQAGRGPQAAASEGRAPVVLSLTLLRLNPDRHMAVLADVTEQVAQRRRLDEVDAWFSALSDGAGGHASFGLDAQGRVQDWNDAACRLFGLEAEVAIGLDGEHLLAAAGGAPALAPRLARVRQEGWQVMDGWMAGPAGGRFWGTSVISAAAADAASPASRAFLAVVRDMTDRRESAQALRQALCQDHLTGLLNRRRFFELGEAECLRARTLGESLSVIMVDADHFKAINDRHGHAAGDTVLREMAALLRHLTREDVDLVGRLGGEEFAVLLPGRRATAAMAVAGRLREALAGHGVKVAHRDGSERTLRLTASFGVAEQPASGGRLEALLETADAALFAAKAAGRDCVRLG